MKKANDSFMGDISKKCSDINNATSKEHFIHILDGRKDLQQYLYSRGFLFTDSNNINIEQYPFYNNWNITTINHFYLYTHKKQTYYLKQDSGTSILLVGHAYNPFDLNYSEEIILNNLIDNLKIDEKHFIQYLNQLTGVFALLVISDKYVRIFGDCTGMQTCYYGRVGKNLFISSHTQLIGDICNLEFLNYVTKLVNYKYYNLFGKSMPADITPYQGILRLIPNFYCEYRNNQFSKYRFFPNKKIEICNSDSEYNEVISKCCEILKNTMEIIHKKWERPAISLTGGCDSKTTLSATVGNYEKYSYFSYTSQTPEKVDADAAHNICHKLGLKHKIYEIDDNNDNYKDYHITDLILQYNCGNIGKNNQNDIRKRIYFTKVNDFDVEVKSWVSEVTRAYYHKRFSKKSFPKKPAGKYLATLYKVFFTNRKLFKETCLYFDKYLEEYYDQEVFNFIPWYDLIFWEFRMSSWNGGVISGEHKYSFDITIPYNNRSLLSLLLSTPLEKRISDQPHKDIMKMCNPDIANIGINVTNVKHTSKRAMFEKIYLNINSHLPF